MCPGTLAALAGATLSAVSSIAGGISQGNAASYQAQVSRNNATIARQNAGYASSAAEGQTEQAALKSRAQQSNLRAGLAASGVDVNTGSAADVQEGQREIGALDTSTVASNAAQPVRSYQSKAAGFDAQAKLDSAEAEWDPIAGAIEGVGGFLSNKTVDDTLFGGPSDPSSGGSSAAAGVATGMPRSLLSGPPSVPSAFAWMQTPTDQDISGGLY